MARPRKDARYIAQAIELIKEGYTISDAAATVGHISERTLYRALAEINGIEPDPEVAPNVAPIVQRAIEPPRGPDPAVAQEVNLLAHPSWRRVRDALVEALKPYPEAAHAVLKALRSIA